MGLCSGKLLRREERPDGSVCEYYDAPKPRAQLTPAPPLVVPGLARAIKARLEVVELSQPPPARAPTPQSTEAQLASLRAQIAEEQRKRAVAERQIAQFDRQRADELLACTPLGQDVLRSRQREGPPPGRSARQRELLMASPLGQDILLAEARQAAERKDR